MLCNSSSFHASLFILLGPSIVGNPVGLCLVVRLRDWKVAAEILSSHGPDLETGLRSAHEVPNHLIVTQDAITLDYAAHQLSCLLVAR